MNQKAWTVIGLLIVLVLILVCSAAWPFLPVIRDRIIRPAPTAVVLPTQVVVNEPTQAPTFVPTQIPATAIPATAVPFTPTALPPTAIPFTGTVIKDCPLASLGYHPDSGQPLMFKMHPYEGDKNVLCEYELLFLDQEAKITFSPAVVAIVTDWTHGTYNADGTLKDACPTGWECEGTWVATKDFIVPVGTLVHLFVYVREIPAMQRFTEFNQWWAAFPCEYIATQGHSMWNIRVPAWAQAQGEVGTIYGFGLPVGDPNRLTCPGFPIDWEPQPGQLTTE